MILFSSIFPEGLSLKNLLIGKNLVKFVNLGSILLYDTLESISYNTPSATVTYKTTLSSTGETVAPIINASQSWKRYGYSGKAYKQSNITNFTTEYSIIQDNDGFTLDTSTGVVTCSNNLTTSSRTFKINVDITMDKSEAKLNKLIEFTQSAGTQIIEYTDWETDTIQISASDTNVSASLNEVLLTTIANLVRYKNTYINGVLVNNTQETQSIIVTPTYSISGNGFSISNSTVIIDDRGTVIGNERIGTVTASYSGVTNSINITQEANTATIDYGVPSVTLIYNNLASAAGETVYPTISYSLSRILNYTSGSTSSLSSLTSGGSISYVETTDHDAASINNSSGAVKWKANKSTNSRSCGITVTVTMNGLSGTGTANCILDGDTVESTSYDYRVVLNASDYTSSSSACSSDGGSTTLSYTIYRTEVKHWVSGDTTYGTESTYNATPSFSGSATGFSRNGTTITISENTNSSSRSCTYTASYGGASDSVTIYQEGFTDYIVEYGVPTVSIGDGMTAAGGSATVTASVMNTYASGAKKPGTVTLEITTNGNLRFSLSGNTLSHDNMGTSTIPDLVTITAFNANSTNKQATDTVTITNDIISTEVNSISITEFSYDNLEPLISQSASPDLTVYANMFDIYASGSQGNSYDKEITSGYDTTYSISDSTYFTINSSGTCTTKYSNNENTDRLATVSVLVLYGGKTATASTTITLLAAKYVTLTIRRSNYDGDWALFDSSTPLTDKSIYYILQNGTSTFRYSPEEGIKVNNESGSRTTVSVPGTVYVWDVDLYNIWTFAGEVYVNGTNLSININYT